MTIRGMSAWSRAGEDEDVQAEVSASSPLHWVHALSVQRPPWIDEARRQIAPRMPGPVPPEVLERVDPEPAWEITWSPPYLEYTLSYAQLVTNRDPWEEWFSRWFVHLGYGIAVDISPIIHDLGVWNDPGIRPCVERFVEAFVSDVVAFGSSTRLDTFRQGLE